MTSNTWDNHPTLKRGITCLVALGIAASAASCSSQEKDFKDAAQRNETLIAYTCERIVEDAPSTVYSIAANEYRTLPQYVNLDAADKASADRNIKMGLRGVFTPTCDSSDKVNYQPWAVQGYMHYLETESFSYETAKDRGLVD